MKKDLEAENATHEHFGVASKNATVAASNPGDSESEERESGEVPVLKDNCVLNMPRLAQDQLI